MRILWPVIFSVAFLSEAIAGLSDSFQQQQAKVAEPVVGAEEQYELVKRMRQVVAEALAGKSAKSDITVPASGFDKYDPYKYFFTEKYLVRFGGQYGAPSQIFGQEIKCGMFGYGREGFGASYPYIIGVKDGSNYTQTKLLRDMELEVSSSNSDHCFIRRSVSSSSDIEKCTISYQALEAWQVNMIRKEFNNGLSDCAKTYNYPKFDDLKL